MLSDQDDIWLPQKVEKTYKFLKQNNSDLVFTDLLVVDEKGNEVNKSFDKLMNLTKKNKKNSGNI